MINLKEALVRKNRDNNVSELIYSEVIDFLKQNYKFKLRGEYRTEIEKYIKFQDGIVDVLCNVGVSNDKITSLTDGLFNFNYIDGYFDCRDCENLNSLEGAPKYVGGDFDCNGCEKLKSLEGAPEKVGGFFDCSNCPNLESLEGAPEKVGGFFDCRDCENLNSLEGAPKIIKDRFYHDKNLK